MMGEEKLMDMMDALDEAVDAYRTVLDMRIALKNAEDRASKDFSKALNGVEKKLLDVICVLHGEVSKE